MKTPVFMAAFAQAMTINPHTLDESEQARRKRLLRWMNDMSAEATQAEGLTEAQQRTIAQRNLHVMAALFVRDLETWSGWLEALRDPALTEEVEGIRRAAARMLNRLEAE